MPANRSRTENWKQSLRQVFERRGALEIAFKQSHPDGAAGADLLFRVRILDLNDNDMVLESPAAVGRSMPIGAGVEVVGSMTIGQNRWLFQTRTLGHRIVRQPIGPETAGLVVSLPENVERCPRRQHFRISTAELRLPTVECWPLIDPASVVAAENANRLQIQDTFAARTTPAAHPAPLSSFMLPEVGPQFPAQLLNISGGGLGLLVSPEHAPALQRQPFVWMRVDLQPGVPLPLAITARRVHTHLDAMQNLYAGFAFEFAFNPAHQAFVTDVLSRYVDALQRQGVRPAA